MSSRLSWAQLPETQWLFEHLSSEMGLSNVTVRDITQDAQGYLWIATDFGLNRYDGYKFKVYKPNQQDPYSIAHHRSNVLLLDSHGRLLVGGNAGLQIYDQIQDRFLPFTIGSDEMTIKAPVTEIFEDKNRNLWIGTFNEGLWQISPEQSQASYFSQTKTGIHQLKSDNITAIVEDHLGLIWVSSDNGLDVIDLQKRSDQSTNSSVLSKFEHQIIFDLHVHSDNMLWVAGSNGLTQLDLNESQIAWNFMSDTPIQEIAVSRSGQFWLGSTNGVIYFDPVTHQYSMLQHDAANPGSIKGQKIYSIFESIDGVVWFGSHARGLDKMNPIARQFGHRKSYSSENQCLSENLIYAALLDKQGGVWLGSSGKGLHYIDRQKGSCHLYNMQNTNLASGVLDTLVDIQEDSDSNLWLATYNQGLVQFNRKEERFFHYLPGDGNPSNERADWVRSVYVDHHGNIWLGTFFAGLYKFDPRTGHFEHFQDSELDLAKSVINVIAADGEDNIWLGTSKSGLIKFDPISEKFKVAKPESVFTGKNVTALEVDSNNHLWIGTEMNGVYSMDAESDVVVHFSSSHGLASDRVYQLKLDGRKDLWVATANGLSRIDSTDREITSFSYKDGLQDNEFTNAGSYNEASGEMLFAGVNGFNLFHPEEIEAAQSPPSVVLNSLEIFNQEVTPDHTRTEAVLQQSIDSTDQLNLRYFHRVFGLEFAGLHFAAPEQNSYAYRLLGHDREWIHVSSDRRYVSYSNLPAGDYEFQVKAANKYGEWSQDVKRLKVNIEQAPWLTWWAFIIYALILLSIGTTIFVLLLRKHRAQQEVLAARTLAEAKDRIFANVSHEFRTPLSLIIAPVELLLAGEKDVETRNRLTLVKRHANRLSRMVDQFLELAKLDTSINENRQTIELTGLLDSLMISFKPLCDSKKLNFTVVVPEQQIWLSMLPDSLEIILTNLISNAIKYMPENGEIQIAVKVDDDNVAVAVTDNGPGIDEQNQELIFQRFTRAVEEHSAPSQGAGIGLALTKELVEKNDGEISLKSDIGVGSTFAVSLPLVAADLAPQPGGEQPSMLLATKAEIVVLSDALSGNSDNETSNFGDTENLAEKSLLIIEDNSDMRTVIADVFEGSFQCFFAENGEEGLTLGLAQIPDIIICDLMMPGISGFEVVEQFRGNELTSHIPIIMLTAKQDTQSRLQGWEKCVDEYITKPFLPKELQLRVDNLLTLRAIVKQQLQKQLLENDKSEPVSLPALNEKDQAFIDKFVSIIEQNFASPTFDRNTASKAMFVSEKQLSRKLSGLLDTNFTDYLKDFRLQRSVEMFITGKQVAQIADDSGFSSPSYYIRCFKQKYGMTPNQYRDSQKK